MKERICTEKGKAIPQDERGVRKKVLRTASPKGVTSSLIYRELYEKKS